MDIKYLNSLLQPSAVLSDSDIRQINVLWTQYPWYWLINVLYLKTIQDKTSRTYQTLLSQVALLTPSRVFLSNVLTTVPSEKTSNNRQTAQSTKMIDDAVLMSFSQEYFEDQVFEQNDNSQKDLLSNLALIDQFIREKPRIVPKMLVDAPSVDTSFQQSIEDSSDVTSELLADIYVQQGHIDLAIKCYDKLILLNPEKSAYFALLIERLNCQK